MVDFDGVANLLEVLKELVVAECVGVLASRELNRGHSHLTHNNIDRINVGESRDKS